VDPSFGIVANFASDGTLSGFDGCQNFTAKYKLSGSQITITKYKPATGISNCLPDALTISQQYIKALTEVTKYQIKGTTLSLTDAQKKQRLQYTAKP
jgi:heat shock protein HslJ